MRRLILTTKSGGSPKLIYFTHIYKLIWLFWNRVGHQKASRYRQLPVIWRNRVNILITWTTGGILMARWQECYVTQHNTQGTKFPLRLQTTTLWNFLPQIKGQQISFILTERVKEEMRKAKGTWKVVTEKYRACY